MKNLILSFCVIALVSGCATGGYQITGNARPKISPDAVKIYDQMPTGAVIIGTVSGTNPNGLAESTHPEMGAIKKQAGEIGANGVVLTGKSFQTFVGWTVTGTAFFVQ